jgi:hypothetical protein
MTRERKEERKNVRLDADALRRLQRLMEQYGDASATMRKALLHLELEQGYVRDLVQQAVLDLAAAVQPDERYDPEDDPRPEQATLALSALLGSVPAAEGIGLALRELALKADGG